MKITFEVDNLSEKELDDVALEVISYLRDVEQVMVTDYWVGEE